MVRIFLYLLGSYLLDLGDSKYIAIFPNGFDFGCLSFLTVLLTMIVLFRYVIPKVQADEKVSPYVLLLFPIAQCLVVINYGIPAIVLMKNQIRMNFCMSLALQYYGSSVPLYHISCC